MRVTEVPAAGPAARAGLRPGDVIIAIDGRPVAGLTSGEVQRLLTGEVGSSVELEIERDGKRERLRVERAPYETSKRAGPRASTTIDRPRGRVTSAGANARAS